MRITELQLQTTELHAQRAFYSRTLGLPLVQDEERAFGVQAGWTRLVFQQAEKELPGAYHFAFNIPENLFPLAQGWLEERTQPLPDSQGQTSFNFRSWNAHSIYFRDPDGNILELIARHGLPNTAPGPFGPGNLLAVSEVGLATDDVPVTVARLREDLEIDVYSGSGGTEFSALGNEEGLLIVVLQGRIWFPDSGVPAAALPLRMRLETTGGRSAWLEGPPYVIR